MLGNAVTPKLLIQMLGVLILPGTNSFRPQNAENVKPN